MSPVFNSARAETTQEGDVLAVSLGGVWRMTEPQPSWKRVLGDRRPGTVRLTAGGLARWDSSLARFVREVERWCAEAGAGYEASALPAGLRRLAAELAKAEAGRAPPGRRANILATVGLAATDLWRQTKEFADFTGECTLSAVGMLKRPGRFRWRDCLEEMQQCGVMAVPIVSLASFLVGLTLAYTGAIVLRQFGGDIWVADIVGLSTFREMGAVMTGMVIAGRTGAAFAAQLGNMKAGEEIDALETLGIPAVEFLVLPRLLALSLMMPLLAMYANFVSLLGGMLVAWSVLSIPASAYWIEMQTTVDLSDVSAGVIKSVTFGVLIAVAGCLRGLQADRSAAGVGRAATSAAVTGILLIILADAVFAVLFHGLGI